MIIERERKPSRVRPGRLRMWKRIFDRSEPDQDREQFASVGFQSYLAAVVSYSKAERPQTIAQEK